MSIYYLLRSLRNSSSSFESKKIILPSRWNSSSLGQFGPHHPLHVLLPASAVTHMLVSSSHSKLFVNIPDPPVCVSVPFLHSSLYFPIWPAWTEVIWIQKLRTVGCPARIGSPDSSPLRSWPMYSQFQDTSCALRWTMMISQGLCRGSGRLSPFSLRPHFGRRLLRPRQLFFPLSCLTGSIEPRTLLLPRASPRERSFPLESSKGAGQLRIQCLEWPVN